MRLWLGFEPHVQYKGFFRFLVLNTNLALSKHETVNSSLMLAYEHKSISGCRLNASVFASYTYAQHSFKYIVCSPEIKALLNCE